MTLDELGEYGMSRMDDEAIRAFLSTQGMGVLGLPTGETPYLVPLSYGFDGEATLYFTYVLGAESRKEELTQETDRATFLVCDVPSSFNWESVVLRGHVSELPPEEWEEHAAVMEPAWRPDLLQRASTEADVKVYRFEIEEQVGIRHTGLPAGFRTGSGDADADV